MIRHLLRLTWNRRRANALVVVEIAAAFVVLAVVATLAADLLANYRRPLGFTYDNVLDVAIDRKVTGDDSWTPEMLDATRRLHYAVAALPEVEASAGVHTPPFGMSRSTSVIDHDGRSIGFERGEVTDDAAAVLGIRVLSGRWFGREDDGSPELPTVLNLRLARELFGDEDPIGRVIDEGYGDRRRRVVGVVEDFRRGGEFDAPTNYLFERVDMRSDANRPPQHILVRVRPGTPAAFEESLARALKGAAPDWSYEIEPLDANRAFINRIFALPVAIGGVVAGFLLVMVALGLTGVVWQNVTRRRREIGLRRVQGATAGDIYRQIVGELLLVATAAILVGLALVAQLPALGLAGDISPRVYVPSVAASILAIYLVTICCALAPSRLAARVSPVEALRYE